MGSPKGPTPSLCAEPVSPFPLWQRETQRAENHMRVRRGRGSGRDVPGRPRQIGILPNELQRAVFRVLPEGVVIAERRLLKLPVGRRGTWEAEPQITSRRNHGVVALEIRAAVITEELDRKS